MTVTAAGIVTSSGILISAYYLAIKDWRILIAFFCFCSTFFSVNIAVQNDVIRSTYEIMYALPAMSGFLITLFLFRKEMNSIILSFVCIYLFNIFGNWIQIDVHKLISNIDLLDILAWTQLYLLIRLAQTAPSGTSANGRDGRISS